MKRLIPLKRTMTFNRLICGLFSVFSVVAAFAQTATEAYTTDGSHVWTVPQGVTSVTIETWGAGGGGGGTYSGFQGSDVRASGGGGGAYSTVTIAVTPGQTLDITVGAGGAGGNEDNNGTVGGTSAVDISGTTVCSAAGGQGGRYHRGNGNTGSGSAAGGASGVGFLYAGGNGGSTGGSNGDGGGGAGGTTEAGGNGTDTAAGTGGQVGGGNGGNPATANGNGHDGYAPGGGGGGSKQAGAGWSFTANTARGGAGARGEVRVTYCAPPSAPVEIVGLTTPCEESVQTYSVTQDPYATSYTWTLPSGWSGTSTINVIDVTLDQTGGQISVVANGVCGTSLPQVLDIVPSTVPAQPDVIVGEENPCEATVQNYSVTEDTDASGYTWTLPGDWSGSGTTNTITIVAGGNSGVITVEAVNQCGASVPQTLDVSTTPLPGQPSVISGNTALCLGDSETFSVVNDPAVDEYIWTIPAGWTGTSTTNEIDVTAAENSGAVTVVSQNSCGTSPVRVLNVVSADVPAQPSDISGSDLICQGETVNYDVTLDPSAVNYVWTFPVDWTGSGTTNSISLTMGATSGTISVSAENQCGASVAQTLNVTVNPVTNEVTQSGVTLTATQTGAIYQWIDCATGAPIGGATGQSYTPLQNGEYSVLVITPENCTVVSGCVVVNNLSVEQEAFTSMSVYPNPATDKVVISSIPSESTVRLLDMTGKVLYAVQSGSTLTMDLTDVKAGVYLLTVENKKGSATQKLVVKK